METQSFVPKSEVVGVMARPLAGAQAKAGVRLLFVDNLRVFLTILVLLHHLMIIYAGSGDWIFQEGRQDVITSILGEWFCAVNQAYFMSFFFLISAYFIPGSIDRKGVGRFLKDRLIRLGIPLVIYSWIIHPVWVFAYQRITGETQLALWPFLTTQYVRYGAVIGAGPTWFVSLLLILSAIYALARLIGERIAGQNQGSKPPSLSPASSASFPRTWMFVAFAVAMALIAFVVRLWFPVDWNFGRLNFQLPFFTLYIALFFVGVVAYRQDWFRSLPDSTGRRWIAVAIGFILLHPIVAVLGGALEDSTPFLGGWHWQSLLYTTWESFLCVSMIIGLTYLFRRYASRQEVQGAWLSRQAYGAYLVQAPVMTLLALPLYFVDLYPLLKWMLVSMVAVPSCFLVAALLRKLPYADRVL